MGQVNKINELQGEVDALRLRRREVNKQISELPEALALKEAQDALLQATETLRVAMRSNRDYARLADERGEVNWKLRDLEELLSRSIEAYHEDSGRDVVLDSQGVKRAIEAKYSLGKPALDQPRLPFSSHFEQRVPIAEASK